MDTPVSSTISSRAKIRLVEIRIPHKAINQTTCSGLAHRTVLLVGGGRRTLRFCGWSISTGFTSDEPLPLAPSMGLLQIENNTSELIPHLECEEEISRDIVV
jgi:hypothetical protein